MRIEKKILPEYFQAILDGRKKFELRLADWECNPGDILVLREYDQVNNLYSGREIEKKVEYVLKTKNVTFWPKEDIEKFGFQIISFD